MLIHLVNAVYSLIVGESLEFKLVNQVGAGERHDIQILLSCECGLLVPVGATVVDSVNRFGIGVPLVFQLFN